MVTTGLPFFFFFPLPLALKLDLTRGRRPSGRTSGPEFPLFPILLFLTFSFKSFIPGSTNLILSLFTLGTRLPCFLPPPLLDFDLNFLFLNLFLRFDFTRGLRPSALNTGGFLNGSALRSSFMTV